MSAIAGLLSLDRHAIEADPAERMAATLGWRGGGGEDGSYRSPDGRATLAARGTAQPLTNETHDIWLVLDGEILNHRALRHTLELLGHRFRGGTAAEVALHAYEHWDLDFPTHLHGTFALALWDDRRDRLVLARDRLGRKPLFVARHRDRLGFASGLDALIRELGLPRRLNPAALAQYLAVGVVPAPATLVAGITQLAAGEMLVADRNGGTWRRLWRGLAPGGAQAPVMRPLPAERHAGNLRTLLECAVADHLGGDGRVAVWLTPSVTSGALAAIATRLTGVPPLAVAVGDGPDGAAAADLRTLARTAGIEPIEMRVDAAGVAAALPDMAFRLAAPVAATGLLAGWFAAAALAPTRTGAVLADAGAEQMLLTHPVYAPFRPGGWRAVLRRLVSGGGPGGRGLPVAARPFAGDAGGLLAVTLPVAAPALPALPPWLGDDALAVAGLDDLALRMADGMAPGLDAAAQAHGLEVRLPFLDNALVDYAVAVPGRIRCPAGAPHRLARRVLGDLVPAALVRKASPPPLLPLAEWLAGPLGEELIALAARWPVLHGPAVAALVDAHRADRCHGDALWALLVLAQWCASLGLDQVAAVGEGAELVHSRS